MGYYQTDCVCNKCEKGYYRHYEVGQQSSRSYFDYYMCPVCGHDPDKERKENKEHEYNEEI